MVQIFISVLIIILLILMVIVLCMIAAELIRDMADKLKTRIRYAGKKGSQIKEFEDLEFCGEIILIGYHLALITGNTERAETEKENLINQAEKIKDLGYGDKSVIVNYVAKHFE